MDASLIIRRVRERSGLSLRRLATATGTSHSTISAYESGRKTPSVATLDRLVRAAGYSLDARLVHRHRGSGDFAKGEELLAVLELAAAFPARHQATMACPAFPQFALQSPLVNEHEHAPAS